MFLSGFQSSSSVQQEPTNNIQITFFILGIRIIISVLQFLSFFTLNKVLKEFFLEARIFGQIERHLQADLTRQQECSDL